jgi:hypothetical protein
LATADDKQVDATTDGVDIDDLFFFIFDLGLNLNSSKVDSFIGRVLGVQIGLTMATMPLKLESDLLSIDSGGSLKSCLKIDFIFFKLVLPWV